jgi:hypothetical protein
MYVCMYVCMYVSIYLYLSIYVSKLKGRGFYSFHDWFKSYGKYKPRKRSILETSSSLSSEDIV